MNLFQNARPAGLTSPAGRHRAASLSSSSGGAARSSSKPATAYRVPYGRSSVGYGVKLYTAAELSEIVAKWPEGHFEDEDGNTVPGPVQAPTAAATAAKVSPPATLSATAPRLAPSAFRRPAIIESMEQPGATMPRTVQAPAASVQPNALLYADTFLKAKRGDPEARAELARMSAAITSPPQADTRDPVAFVDSYFNEKRAARPTRIRS